MYRFSGHESFPCRYTWIPKAYTALTTTPDLFRDETEAMVQLGVGKNMVKSIRFWIQVAGVFQACDQGLEATPFGKAIFAEDGHDPYMEDIKTSWLIHWNISTNHDAPLFAWHYTLNTLHKIEFTRKELEQLFYEESAKQERKLSPVTINQHIDVFLRSYLSKNSSKSEILEDSLDCPLSELQLINIVGERKKEDSSLRDPIYSFRSDEKDDITPQIFTYCLNDFWEKTRSNDKTLSLNDIAYSDNSPGQLLKIPEQYLRDRLESLKDDSEGLFQYEESATLQQVIMVKSADTNNLLSKVYA